MNFHFWFSEEVQHVQTFALYLMQKHKGFHPRIDLTMETKAQFVFFLSNLSTVGEYRDISAEAETIKEKGLSSFIHVSWFMFFTAACLYRL